MVISVVWAGHLFLSFHCDNDTCVNGLKVQLCYTILNYDLLYQNKFDRSTRAVEMCVSLQQMCTAD